jgi:hypothetical protein
MKVRGPTQPKSGQEGIALIASMILLMGLTALVLAASLTAVMEKNVTVNHRASARALYAADSGVEVARQFITGYAKEQLDSLTAVWGGNGVIITDPHQVFPAQGFVFQNLDNPAFSCTTFVTFEDSTLDLQSQVYNYRYRTVSSGSHVGGQRVVESEGRLRVSATRGSFADYLIFTDTHLVPGGSPIWFHTTGHFDGRVHTNDEFRFAYFPTFEDLVSSVDDQAWYYNQGRPRESNRNRNGNVDVPNFYGGLELDASRIDLPQNSFSQERAALGGNPANTSPVTNAEIRDALGLAAGVTPPPDGVYVPQSGGQITGGIYVAGDATEIKLSIVNGNQVMKIKDSGNHVTMVTIDEAANTTKVTPPSGAPVTLNGLPRGVVYAKGEIEDLGGPNRAGGNAVPALARNQQLSIVASGDVVIQNDLAYEDYDNGENVLGVFSSGGDIRVGSRAPDDLVVDAYVLASDGGKVFTVDGFDRGAYRGEVHLRGGMVTNYYGAFGTFSGNDLTGYGRDFRYDRRGYVPPYYPLTSRYVPDQPQPNVLAWREVTE